MSFFPDTPRHSPRHHHHFLAWMRSPRKIGALVPSSRALAAAMAMQIDLKQPGAVVELGAGTGVVTHALLQAGLAPQRLIVIERNAVMHASLSEHFPQLTIVHADAMDLEKVLAERGVSQINAIVSSLPLLSMPRDVRAAIEARLAGLVAKQGRIVQFTYGPKSPIGKAALKKHGLTKRWVKTVLTNVPPAHIWVYQRN